MCVNENFIMVSSIPDSGPGQVLTKKQYKIYR